LITLIGIPLVQGLNLTRASQSFAEAQDIGREVVSRINKELSTAAVVLDNSVPEASVEIALPRPGNANPGYVDLHNAKIDFLSAAQGNPSQPQFNPGRNKIDPTLKASIGQVILPLAPGQRLTRYWIGLRRPIDSGTGDAGHYVNPWIPTMAGANEGNENLYVLYRADVLVYVYNPAVGRYVPNTDFFAVDAAGQPIINDPGFFEFTPSVFIDSANAHRQRLANWIEAAHLVVQDSRTDLIMPEIDEATGDVVYEPYSGGGTIPKVRSLISFEGVRVNSEPALGNDPVRHGEEVVDASSRISSEFFQTKMAGWTTDTLARVYRGNPGQLPRPPYYIGRWRQPAGSPNYLNEIVFFDPTNDSNEYGDGSPIFNVTGYQASVDAGVPDIGRNIYPAGGVAPQLMLFTVDQRRGRIQMRFPARAAFGYTPTISTSLPNSRLTGWRLSGTRAQYDPSGSLGRRFIDLRNVVDFPATAPNFNPFQATVLGYSNPFPSITPGSDVVIGPDQRPGPNFGLPIRYTRVAAAQSVGLNQYKVNYTDLKTPNWQILGLPDPNTNNDVKRYIEPRFKRGYIEFYSDPTLILPTGNIVVEFDFQVNSPTDAVVVDYDTNQEIRVNLTVRRYSGGYTVAPQTVTVTDVVAIRNFAR
jgi:hypothetical protein